MHLILTRLIISAMGNKTIGILMQNFYPFANLNDNNKINIDQLKSIDRLLINQLDKSNILYNIYPVFVTNTTRIFDEYCNYNNTTSSIDTSSIDASSTDSSDLDTNDPSPDTLCESDSLLQDTCVTPIVDGTISKINLTLNRFKKNKYENRDFKDLINIAIHEFDPTLFGMSTMSIHRKYVVPNIGDILFLDKKIGNKFACAKISGLYVGNKYTGSIEEELYCSMLCVINKLDT
jgi:hypothetical protein